MNPHPPLTGVPFALVLLLGVNELFYKRSARRATRIFLLWCLLGGSIVTCLTGYWGADFAHDLPPGLIGTHQAYAWLFLLSLCPLILFGLLDHLRSGNKVLTVAFYLCLATALGVVIKVGSLGGELVFEHGAGVSVQR